MDFNQDAAWEHAEREFPNATDEQQDAVVRAKAVVYLDTLAAAGLTGDDEDFM